MHFKLLTKIGFSILILLLTSCDGSYSGRDSVQDNVIGIPLNTQDHYHSSTGDEASHMVIFDETIRKIHVLDLLNLNLKQTIIVDSPDEKHFVVGSGQGLYTIDLTYKKLTIYNQQGRVESSIKFIGTPRSTAFKPELGLMVVYDDLQNVHMMKLNQNGKVLKSVQLGPVIDNASIVAGDIDNKGQLILSLSTNKLAIMDIEHTLDQKSWQGSVFDSGLDRILWLAPLSQRPDVILANTLSKVVLYNISTQSILGSIEVTSSSVLKLSKNKDPHIVVRSSHSFNKLIYSDGQTLLTREFLALRYLDGISYNDTILSSDLDLNQDVWNCIYTQDRYSYIYNYNDPNLVKDNRYFKKVRLSDQLTMMHKNFRKEANIKTNSHSIISLFPSKLGYIESFNPETNKTEILKHFNLGKFNK